MEEDRRKTRNIGKIIFHIKSCIYATLIMTLILAWFTLVNLSIYWLGGWKMWQENVAASLGMPCGLAMLLWMTYSIGRIIVQRL